MTYRRREAGAITTQSVVDAMSLAPPEPVSQWPPGVRLVLMAPDGSISAAASTPSARGFAATMPPRISGMPASMSLRSACRRLNR